MTNRLHVYIEGRVQGVGFRYSTHDQAVRLGLKGWVRNLPDSRVEAEFEGEKDDLETMLEWCHEGPRLANVTRVDSEWELGEPRYKAFEFRGY